VNKNKENSLHEKSPDIASTVWKEEGAWIDRVPKSVAMAAIFVIGIALWQIVIFLGIVSPIILPSPLETLEQIFFVGNNLITGGYMLKALWMTLKEVFLRVYFSGFAWIWTGSFSWRDSVR